MKVEDFKAFYDSLPQDMQSSIDNGYLDKDYDSQHTWVLTPTFEGGNGSLSVTIMREIENNNINEIIIGYASEHGVYDVEKDYRNRNVVIERFNVRIGLSRIGEIGEAQLALVVNVHTKDNLKAIMSRHIDQLIYKCMAIYEVIW